MGALFGDDAALVHDVDAVGVADRGEAVGDDDHRAVGGEASQGALDGGLGLVVHGGGGLVEDHDRGVLEDRAGQGDPLPLSAGERGTAFTDQGVVAVRQRRDEGVGLGHGSGPEHFLVRGCEAAVADVVRDAAVEEERVLGDEADGVAQAVPPQVPNVLSVDQYPPGLGVLESHQQSGDRRLAGAGGAHQGGHLPGRDGQREVFQGRR